MPGRVLLDTSVIIAHFRNEQSVSERLLDAALLFVPITALGELYTGAFRKKQNQDKALETIEDFVSSVKLLRPDHNTARHYGELRSQVMSKGKPIPDNDLWIAATAVQYGIPLANRDPHFDEIDSLEQQKW
jgi:tRNA(fMet)-specific endonuclease VapC